MANGADSQIHNQEDTLLRRGDLQPPLDAVEPIQDTVEPAADLDTKFCLLTLNMGIGAMEIGDRAFHRAQAQLLLVLVGPHLPQLGTDGPEVLQHKIIAHVITLLRLKHATKRLPTH